MPRTRNALWKRMWGEDRGRRVFAVYMVLVFVIGVTTQGLALSASDETTPTSEPIVANSCATGEEPVEQLLAPGDSLGETGQLLPADGGP